MTTQVCVDASFALKLVLAETDSEAVHARWTDWIAQDAEIIAPCHILFEATSVIRNHVYRRDISPEAGQLAFEAFLAQDIRLLPGGRGRHDDLAVRAWELAQHYQRPTTYDTYYLALAESAGCELWTADGRLYRAVRADLPWVHSLASP